MISWGISVKHSSLHCNFCQRNRIWVEPPTCQADFSPAMQRTHLEPQLSKVISLVTLPQAIISTPVLPKHQSMDQWQSMIKLSRGHRQMRKIRTKQWLLIQLNVCNLKNCPLFWDHVFISYFCCVFNIHALSLKKKKRWCERILKNSFNWENKSLSCYITPPLPLSLKSN